MTSPHTLSFRLMLSSLTGLVLLAFAAACPELRLHSHKIPGVVEASSQAVGLGNNNSRARPPVIAATADLDIDDEEPPRLGAPPTLSHPSERIAFALEFAPTHRAAALTHPPCASPPTGPPHA